MNFSKPIRCAIKKLLLEDIDTEENIRLEKNYADISDSGWPKRGAFGAVHKMLRLKDLEEVAVKEIELNLTTNYNNPAIPISRLSRSVRQDSKATFEFLMACQEAVLQSMEEFRHVNIVRCYESWVRPPANIPDWDEHMDPERLIDFLDDNSHITAEMKRCLTAAKGMKFYIVMDLYQESLTERYERANDTPSRDETRSVIAQISRALKFVHENGYVHRDLKPQNVLIKVNPNDSDCPEVALGDFGLCRKVSEEYVSHGGTPPYDSAPEARVTVQFDMWSLGFLIFELLYMSEPDVPATKSQVHMAFIKLEELAKKGGDQVELKKFVGSKVKCKSLKSLIVKCLKVDPAERVSSQVVADN